MQAQKEQLSQTQYDAQLKRLAAEFLRDPATQLCPTNLAVVDLSRKCGLPASTVHAHVEVYINLSKKCPHCGA